MRTRFLLSVTALSAVAATDLRAVQTPLPSCEPQEAALRAAPNSLEAIANYGRCAVRDYELIAPNGDSTRLAFRTGWDPAARALRRAVEADPSYARAYGPLFRMLVAETRDGCSRVTSHCLYVAPVLRRGDSLLTPPRLVERRPPPDTIDTYDEVIAESRATERASLLEAQSLASRWLAVAPNDRRPHEYLGRALLGLGDSVGAATAFERGAALGTPESRRAIFWERFAALVKADRGMDARRALAEAANDPGRDTMRLRTGAIAALHGLLGQHRPLRVDSARWRADSARFAELRARRPLDTTRRVREPSFEELIASGDTARARRLAARIDSMYTAEPGAMRIPPVGQEVLHSARRYLALRDTARAETQLAAITGLLDQRRLEYVWGIVFGDSRPWMGHAWALAGDVAAARGRTDDAARMYRRVIGLWEGGDPDTRPVVEHARTRLAALLRR